MHKSMLVLMSCAALVVTREHQDSSPANPTIKDLGWMAGDWEGKLGGAQIEEHWTKPAGGTMIGMGRALGGDRTLFFEYLRIEQRKAGIVYIAHPAAAKGTEFKLTKWDADSATFENPAHDNPKIIVYRKTKDGLAARTEGDEDGRRVTQDIVLTRMKS